jgi:hypothetical protein
MKAKGAAPGRSVLLTPPGFGTRCKVLPNKDHATCGKERFIGTRLHGCHSPVQSEAAWLKRVVGFIGGAKPWGMESLWPPITYH